MKTAGGAIQIHRGKKMAAFCLLLRGVPTRVSAAKLLTSSVYPTAQFPFVPASKALCVSAARSAEVEDYKHHDHTKLWAVERAVSAALVPLVPLGIAFPSPFMDYAVALAITIHSHWGLEAIVVDYIRPSIFGSAIPKVSLGILYLISAMTLGGLFYFNYSDVGICQAVRLLWRF